ncbi:Uu.00g120850.m01.CDS01 [Anthostomella pinea]|uniref:Uu.00g120850.m01.CDS01 n=1 Tax=Anthostomella pinea TaxID=933095 RepID=A0AAI8VHK4_9PEZI|nr:Uu.00g120850.m01.CDS01 [Anthostomella pinea]
MNSSSASASASTTTQSKRPDHNRHDTSDSQVSDHASHVQHRPKPQKHVVGAGGRLHPRTNSSKALPKYHGAATAARPNHPNHPNRRQPSPSPERSPMLPQAQTHRRATSDLKLPKVPYDDDLNALDALDANTVLNSALKKNHSHSSLSTKRNRSHVDIAKRNKSAANIRRSSSHKDVHRLKGPKSQVHFDLGNDGQQEDEWVDASASASPYMSRRSSVNHSSASPAKPPPSKEAVSEDKSRPNTPEDHPLSDEQDEQDDRDDQDEQDEPDERDPSPSREVAEHNSYITSRLLRRTPSHSAPPQMSAETASVPPHAVSPASQTSHGPPSLYGTPKTSTFVGSGPEELTSRFVNGAAVDVGANGETGSYFTPIRAEGSRSESARWPRSLGSLSREHRDPASGEEDDSALAPRTRRVAQRAAPAGQSRTQQKLNLQRASSTIEPAQAGGGVGVVGASPLVGGTDYDNRDPRIGKLLERTGMEYMVVRRYQNPIARSIARLSQLPSVNKNQRIQKPNGVNGAPHSKKLSEGRLAVSQSLVDMARSRPVTPRRSTSIRTPHGASSSFDANEDGPHDRMSGSIYVDGNNDGVAAILRNLWDKNMDLGASQD